MGDTAGRCERRQWIVEIRGISPESAMLLDRRVECLERATTSWHGRELSINTITATLMARCAKHIHNPHLDSRMAVSHNGVTMAVFASQGVDIFILDNGLRADLDDFEGRAHAGWSAADLVAKTNWAASEFLSLQLPVRGKLMHSAKKKRLYPKGVCVGAGGGTSSDSREIVGRGEIIECPEAATDSSRHHGTQVASIAASKTYGVAKKAHVVSVQVKLRRRLRLRMRVVSRG